VPLLGRSPPHPPEARQLCAFVALQARAVAPSIATESGLALRLTSGGGVTVTSFVVERSTSASPLPAPLATMDAAGPQAARADSATLQSVRSSNARQRADLFGLRKLHASRESRCRYVVAAALITEQRHEVGVIFLFAPSKAPSRLDIFPCL
jgi:hypothetical protein